MECENGLYLSHIPPSCEPGFHPPGISSFSWTRFPSILQFWWIVKKNSIGLLMEFKIAKKIVNMTSKNCIDMASVISKMLLGKIPLKFHSNGILQFASLFIFHHSGRSGASNCGRGHSEYLSANKYAAAAKEKERRRRVLKWAIFWPLSWEKNPPLPMEGRAWA